MNPNKTSTKGKLILYPNTLITAHPKFQIAIHAISREIFKIEENTDNGMIVLNSISVNNKNKIEDSITTYLFPYIMTNDGDLFPIDHEWQKIFSLLEEKKSYEVVIENSFGIGTFASKAESSRFYSLEITGEQTLKLTPNELENLRSILGGVKYKLNRIKR